MFNIVLGIQILSTLCMIGLILVQHGKGADMGAAFGSGSAGSLFGSSGSANFLSRMTAVSATIFFVSTLILTFMSTRSLQGTQIDGGQSVLDNIPAAAPAAPKGVAEIPVDEPVVLPAQTQPEVPATGKPDVDAIPGTDK